MYTNFENSEMTVRGFFFLVGEGGGGGSVCSKEVQETRPCILNKTNGEHPICHNYTF